MISYEDQIFELENHLFAIQADSQEYGDSISFLTPRLNGITTDLTLNPESLLQLASIIDQTFPLDSEAAEYTLDRIEGELTLGVIPLGDFYPDDENCLLEFLKAVSHKAFKEPVSLHIYIPATGRRWYYLESIFTKRMFLVVQM